MTDDLAHLSLTEVAGRIAARQLSSVEVTRACLDRIRIQGSRLCLVAGIDPDSALAAAKAADDELATHGPRGPLHGVPLAHKDMFYRSGRISACGSRIRADFVPDHTATVLERLDSAGALDIARLNMAEFALGSTGHNEITGTPKNPRNPAYVTGGSSSGSAAAVAGHFVYGSLGSDTGGSIRQPAAFCGVFGMKPTRGRVSRYGAMPLAFSLDVIGPLTRTAEDCALLLQLTAGHDPLDPTTSDRPVPDYLAGLDDGIRGLRITAPEDYFYDRIDSDVAQLMRESLEVLASLGATIVPCELPSMQRASDMAALILTVEGASAHGRWLRERPGDYGSQTLGRLLPGLFCPATRYIEALTLRSEMLAALADAVFARADLIFVPTMPTVAPTILECDVAANPGFLEYLSAFGRCTRPFSYLGLPALSVPAGLVQAGLPAAFQLVGRPFDEASLLRAARAYERETNGAAATTMVTTPMPSTHSTGEANLVRSAQHIV